MARIAAGDATAGMNPEMRLYWEEDTPPSFDGSAVPHRKRWHKVYKQHSGFQLVEVMKDSVRNSTSLFLDRALQLTTLGEHMYHEMMAHVPLMSLAHKARDVLVIGGGDGGVTLRVLRHASVQRVLQVELDEAVVNISRRFFPELACAYDDPRVELRLEDALAWAVREARSEDRRAAFDAIVIDSTDDPLGGPWTLEFFAALRQLLRPSGVMMQNVQNIDVPTQIERLLRLHYAGGFEVVRPVFIGTVDYGSPYVAFLSSGPEYQCSGPAREDRGLVEELQTSWYSAAMHRAALAIPPAVEKRWPAFAADVDGCLVAVATETPRAKASRTGSAAERSAAPDGVEIADFVVVGGGLAGVAAAHVLAKHVGVGSVLLLEAKGRMGGRIEVTDPANFGGVAVNVGANWIHFSKNHPITELAGRLGCPTHASQNANLRWSAAGVGVITEPAIKAARDFAASLSFAMQRDGNASNLWGTSAADYLAKLAREKLVVPEASPALPAATLEAARHLHLFSDVVQDHTARLRDLSASRFCTPMASGDLESNDLMIGGPTGTRCLIDGLLAELPPGAVQIRTGHAVLAASAVPDSTEVELVVAAAGNESASPSQYRVRARRVVLTVPLGVLQASVEAAAAENDCGTGGRTDNGGGVEAGACSATAPGIETAPPEDGILRFDPPVPTDQANRWRHHGNGQSLRIALLFDTVFWDPGVEFYGHIVELDEGPTQKQRDAAFYGDVPAVEFTNVVNMTGRPVLLAEVNKVLADRLQVLPDAEVGEYIVEKALRAMFPDVVVPSLLGLAVKRFHGDPFLRTALSFWSVDEERGGGRTLTQEGRQAVDPWAPLWDKVFFAGEHTSFSHKGTLDGALYSGIEAAWRAACVANGVSSVPKPAELVRALGIFEPWFPKRHDVQGCLKRVSSRLGRLGHGWRAGGPCAERWFEELEMHCRAWDSEDASGAVDSGAEASGERQSGPRRHCLDQGD